MATLNMQRLTLFRAANIILWMLAVANDGSFSINPQPGAPQVMLLTKQVEPAPQLAAPASQSVEPVNIKPLIQAALAVVPKVAPRNSQIDTNKAAIPGAPANVAPVPTAGVVGVAPASSYPVASVNAVGQTISHIPQTNNLKQPAKSLPELGPQSYGTDDPITYLDYSTISDEILHRRTANFVYFNANFNHCRNCYKFFNIWKDLAVDIRWWRQVIRLFAINCSEEDNIDMCRRAGVTQFPQVRYYWIMSNSLDHDGQRLRILGKSVHAMRHLIMDKVLDSYLEHNKLQRSQNQPQSKQDGSLLLSSSSSSSSAGSFNGAPAANSAPSSPANTFGSMLSNPLVGQLLANGGGSSGLNAIMSSLTSGSGKGASSLSGLIGSLGGAQGVGQLVNTLMTVSSGVQGFSNQPMPNNWPEIESIEVGDTQQLVDLLPLDTSKNIGSLLIMETQEFLYTGLETMLDLSPYGNQTYIARVRDERSQLSKNLTKRDDIQAPALIYVTPNGEMRLLTTAPKYTNDEDLRRLFVRKFERMQIKYPVKRVWSVFGAKPAQQQSSTGGGIGGGASSGSTSSDSLEDEEILSKVNQVYMNDLTNAVRVSLMDQVFQHPDLSDDQYNALVKYVYALINYFPFNNEESHKFFKRLHTWLQNQVSPMDISEYKKQFHDIDEVFPRRDWVACKSLSNTKAIPIKGSRRAGGSLFENPAQIGKVVSNITRLFRGQQQQASKLKSLFTALTSS